MTNPSRRQFLAGAGALAAVATAWKPLAAQAVDNNRPNVILIMTDDQGYGDLGCHGNAIIKTPRLDRLHDESVRFDRFYVCPVCSPTRASLMTGRYNYRTGAIDTYVGRSMMHPDETTVAEALGAGGYRTGIFGKWHLGDNYPLRAMDQGFHESLVHRGGGLCQPSDWPGNTYFDPMLSHNGKDVKTSGYCTDVYTDAAIQFIKDNRERPFFAYLATNAPHAPLQIADAYADPYHALGLEETVAKSYGMITNIDDNVGRLLDCLDEFGLAENTIVIFLTDNGPGGTKTPRYNAGMRGHKGTVYEGGIRVPCFVRWPARLTPGKVVKPIAAHIDIMPTLLDACGVSKPDGVELDGRSLMPLLTQDAPEWTPRALFFQWHRGDEPELYRACAVVTQRCKLVNGKELYDLENNPAETTDIAADHADVVAGMRADYETWFRSVGASRGYAPPRIHVGTPHENPVTLTRQDWRGTDGWGPKTLGHWEIHVARKGNYRVTIRLGKEFRKGTDIHLAIGGESYVQTLEDKTDSCTFNEVNLEAGDARLEAWIARGRQRIGVWQVDVHKGVSG